MEARQQPAKLWEWPLQHGDGLVRPVNRGDSFDVELDVPLYSPEGVQVQAQGRDLHVHCESQERDARGNPRMQVDRTYRLPDDVDANNVRSQMGRDGRLSISARK